MRWKGNAGGGGGGGGGHNFVNIMQILQQRTLHIQSAISNPTQTILRFSLYYTFYCHSKISVMYTKY